MKKYTVQEIIVKLILLFPITTLIQDYVSFFNKIVFMVTMLMLMFYVIKKNRIKISVFLWILLALFNYCFALLNTSTHALSINYNMAFYYIFFVFYFLYFIQNYRNIDNIMYNNKKFLLCNIYLYTFLLTISIFIPNCYTKIDAGGWGNTNYFVSFSGSPNRLGPASVFVFVMVLYCYYKQISKYILLCTFPLIYGFFMAGSRTYFVLGILCVIIMLYSVVNEKKWFWLSIVPIGIVLYYVTIQSAMMNKFNATVVRNDSIYFFLAKFTNSRSLFWEKQLRLFQNESMLKKIFGAGINYTSDKVGIWAHNDFIEILCSYGYIGLICYCLTIFFALKKFLSFKKGNRFYSLICVAIWIFNAFFNFFYCYFCAMLSYPLLLSIISMIESKNGIQKETTMSKSFNNSDIGDYII